MEFLTWLLNALHTDLGGTRKRGSSIVHRALQGTVRVSTLTAEAAAAAASSQEAVHAETSEVPFLYLTVDVPAAPLFRDALERNILPQVHASACDSSASACG
jgi:U4/U6.U5 tri-snRNP-associated protein 2